LQKNIESSLKLMPLMMKGCSKLQDIMVLKHNGIHTWMALVKTIMPKITTSYYTSSKLWVTKTLCGSVLLKVYIDMLKL
jgi:hypothetical protein